MKATLSLTISFDDGQSAATRTTELTASLLGAIGDIMRQAGTNGGVSGGVAVERKTGRPRVFVDVKRGLELQAQGYGYGRIARELGGVGRTTVFRALKAAVQGNIRCVQTRGPGPEGCIEKGSAVEARIA